MFFKKLLNFFGKDLAMDLGTANTLLYTARDGIVLNEPSVVALNARTSKVLAVGAEAKEFLGRTPEKIRAVRPLKDGVIADFEVTKIMISYFIKKVIKGLQLVKPKMVICVPTGITQVEMRAVIESAQQAGAREVKLIEEPMAAAIGAQLPIEKPKGNMVVDIGGGTTEVAVISLSAVAYSESVRVAGDELNEAIQRYLKEEYKVLIGENLAEHIKINLGSAFYEPTEEMKVMKVTGKNIMNGAPVMIELTEEEIAHCIKEPVDIIVDSVIRALEKTSPQLVADVAQNGILLAGGGALLKGLDKLIMKRANINVVVDEDPLTTVVRGTGIAMENEKAYAQVFIN